MLLREIKGLFKSEMLELIIDNARQFALDSFVSIQALEGTSTIYINSKQSASTDVVVQNVEARFATDHFEGLWRQIQKDPYFAQVSFVKDNRLTVDVVYDFFARDLFGKLEIAVTDKQTLDQKGRKLRNADAVKQQIQNDYVLRVQEDKYIVVAKHKYGSEDTFQIVNGRNAYSIITCTRRELVDERSLDDTIEAVSTGSRLDEAIWTFHSAEEPFRAANSEYLFELWKCDLELTDETTAARQSASSKAFAESGLDKYLKIWEQYIQIEYEQAQEKQTQAGTLNFKDAEFITGTRYRLTITNPQMLKNFLSVCDSFNSDSLVEIDVTYTDSKGNERTGSCSARLDAADNSPIVEVKFEPRYENYHPATTGEIRLSNVRSEVQYERRMNALNRIKSGEAAKANLAELISGNKISSSNLRQQEKKIAPFHEQVMQCFKGGKPTDAQRNAVLIAMNTPDFAIIQGPTGTGKTTVINAIMQALVANEKATKGKDPQLTYGRNLLTAYQRDATSHVAEKLRLFGLPVPVYRGDQSGSEGDANVKDTSMDQWIKEKRYELLQESPDITSFAACDRLTDKLHLLQINFRSDTAPLGQTRSILEAILSAVSSCMQEEKENYRRSLEKKKNSPMNDQILSLRGPLDFSAQLETINCLLRDVTRKLDKDIHRLDRYYASRLPATDAAMSDNGKEVSRRILRRFQRIQYAEMVTAVVKTLEELYDEDPISYSKIQLRKDILLYLLSQSNLNLVDQSLNEQISSLLDGLLTFVEKSNGTDEQRVLAEYYNAFDEENDGLLREWLSSFMTTIAATHQRAVSGEVKRHKEPKKDSEQPSQNSVSVEDYLEYDNVLIDEAARSCPPDLLIPLSCARERMILVGDQNQLPQFLSSEVYNKLAKVADYDSTERDDLVKKTMFERLIQQVQKLENVDKITRFIMLDQQFRMPATLGNIISKHFYNNELKSPCGNDAEHTPDLAYIKGKHLVWLDVTGGQQKFTDEKSYVRQSEVTAIIRMLKAMIYDSDDSNKYSFAIITFYKGQRDRICQAIMQDDFLCTRQNAIQVGTVDAFQGLEADIVFLSLVRSSPIYDKKKNPYGFLTNVNRQCVALSRAKRCLIVVGDARMVSGNRALEAKQAMPAIEEIYQLCRKEDVKDACIFTDGDFATPTVSSRRQH